MIEIRRVSGLLLIITGFVFAGSLSSYGQQKSPGSANEQPQSKDQSEAQIKLENKAVALLEEVVSEASGLKLPDNRVRVLIAGGDLLWSRDPARARDMFTQASVATSQMMLTINGENRNEADLAGLLRSELVLTVARHDAELAYQLMRSTRPDPNDKRFDANSESRLEDSLLATIAATDPAMALSVYRDAGQFGPPPEQL